MKQGEIWYADLNPSKGSEQSAYFSIRSLSKERLLEKIGVISFEIKKDLYYFSITLKILIMLNVRIDKELEEKLEFESKKQGLSKSKIVKDALAMYLEMHASPLNSYELGKDLFGVGEGDIDLSNNYKEKIKQKLNAKHSH